MEVGPWQSQARASHTCPHVIVQRQKCQKKRLTLTNYIPSIVPFGVTVARKKHVRKRALGCRNCGAECQGEASPGWRDSDNCEIFVPMFVPKRCIHFLGGAFVSASPRLFYQRFLEELAEQCEAIVVATPYQLSFDYDLMAASATNKFVSVSSQFGCLPVVAVGHSCGALLHSLRASTGTYEACVLMSFNNKPISDAIPVPLPDATDAPASLRELLRNNIEAVLADDNVEEGLQTARAVFAGSNGSGADLAKAAPVVSQFGPLLGSVIAGKKEFSISREEIFSRLSAKFPVRTLVIQFANDFTDDSNKLTSCIQQAGSEVQLLRFPGGHTSPLDGPIGGSRQGQLSARIAAFVNEEGLPGPRNAQERICELRDQFLRLSAGYNRGFAPMPFGQKAAITECIEELEALKPDINQGAIGNGGECDVMSKLIGKWRLVWATSPDVLLLTSLPLAECGEIRQDIQRSQAGDQLEVINIVELSPKGASLLGAALPEVARALAVVSKVRASGDFEDSLLTLQLAGAELETMAGSPLQLPPIPVPGQLRTTSTSVRLLTTFLDNELRVARTPLGDVFMFSRLL
ncbi:unnamed protein product [Durusdinium trenchii]|uniref:Plastid lipid-associated protein/fibrillin conserved domain-containing protein n=1 Tax=Durusdinium trenchii TaxID=1381693 RepID=A0ABP0JK00_9DINO